jgi:mevalonate kinase
MKVSSPGKVILSGEHAVVHGQPAIACAINRYVTCEIAANETGEVVFVSEQFDRHLQKNIASLRELDQQITHSYQRFLDKQGDVTAILPAPFDLCMLSFIRCFDHIDAHLSQGVTLRLTADLPVGCGLGASAAFIHSIIKATSHYFATPLSDATHLALALSLENCQHGVSSGLDVYTSFFGGMLYYHAPHYRAMDRALPALQFVNTGLPACSTGECVSTVANHTPSSQWPLFKACTDIFTDNMHQSVQKNHVLLVDIGVVPERVQQFIADIEARDGAAKICGAGAVHGERAGIVMVVGDIDLVDLCQHYQYELLNFTGESDGCHVV